MQPLLICLSDAPVEGEVDEGGIQQRTVGAKRDNFFDARFFGQGELGKIKGSRYRAFILHLHS